MCIRDRDTALHHYRAVGTEILGAVAVDDAGGLYARERFAAHDDPGIGLVVLEQDVVARLEGLDQRVFEQDVYKRQGDKWSLLVLTTLYSNGTMRFNDIQRSLGDISQRMLTVTLRSLDVISMKSGRLQFP